MERWTEKNCWVSQLINEIYLYIGRPIELTQFSFWTRPTKLKPETELQTNKDKIRYGYGLYISGVGLIPLLKYLIKAIGRKSVATNTHHHYKRNIPTTWLCNDIRSDEHIYTSDHRWWLDQYFGYRRFILYRAERI